MNNTSSLDAIVILLAVAVVVVAGFRRLNLPPILGYLLVGVLVGPHGWGWISDTADTRFLAEFGVVFLLFTIGLEFSLPQLYAMKKEVLGLGGTQVVLTTVAAGLLAWMFGMSPEGALVVGGTLAMSSTAIVTKQLTEQLELNSRHGRLALGILLFQDLAVIPFLILIPAMSGATDNSVALELLLALVKGALVLAVMVTAGKLLLRPLFYEIASAHSSELFTLTVLLFSLSAAWLTHLSGLSLALGAFLAGIMLGETEFRHQVEADIRPFRDVLLGLFFITVGMLLDIHTLPGIFPWVLLLLLALIVLKTLLIAGLSITAGAEKGVALRTGMVLAQGGEFGFALLALALKGDLLTPESSQIVLAAVIFSMALSPALIRYNGAVAKRFFAASYGVNRERSQEQVAAAARDLRDHIVICGYGRIGQNIARFAIQEDFDYVALDLDPIRVREALAAGEHAYYGDSTHAEILESAGLRRARVLVISFDDIHATYKILAQARELRPDIPILVRTRDDSNLEKLQKAGATEVVPETLEASLMLASHLLMLLDVPMRRVLRRVQDIRTDRYQMLRQFFHGQEHYDIAEAETLREGLHSVELPKGAYAVGRSLSELDLAACGVTVTDIRRNGVEGPPSEPNTVLEEGDVLVLYGAPEGLEHAEGVLLSG